MTSNGALAVKTAVLYARVSGDEQAKKGYSLADQLDALRAWCSENGYEVSREVEDAGYSGAYLERPGLDQVREMVVAGEVEELTGGVLRCAGCGYAMGTNFIIDWGIGYYRCGRRYRLGVDACTQSKTRRTVEAEALVWESVSGVLKDPARLKLGLDKW